MACGSGSNVYDGWAWTTGTTAEIFIPYTDPMNVAEVESFRVEIEFRNRSGDIQIKRGYQYSDDGITWDTAVAFDTASWIATEGFSMPTAYTNTDDPAVGQVRGDRPVVGRRRQRGGARHLHARHQETVAVAAPRPLPRRRNSIYQRALSTVTHPESAAGSGRRLRNA